MAVDNTGYLSQSAYTLSGKHEPLSHAEISKSLESTKELNKQEALKELIRQLSCGRRVLRNDSMLHRVIRYGKTDDHVTQRLVQLYLETMKNEDDGSLLLVDSTVRSLLTSSNEHVRAAQLRSLSRNCPHPWLGTVVQCLPENLTHRDTHVRKNACVCIASLSKRFDPAALPFVDDLKKLALHESDDGCRRAAILALAELNIVAAANLFVLQKDIASVHGELCQLAVLRLCREVWHQANYTFPPTPVSKELLGTNLRERLIARMSDFVSGTKDTVMLEAATSLLYITEFDQGVIKDCCRVLVHVLWRHGDVNVSLHVLSIFQECAKRAPTIVESFCVDIFRSLRSPSLEVRQSILDCCLPVVTPKILNEVLNPIREQLSSVMDSEFESSLNNHISQPATKQAGKKDAQTQLVRALRVLCSKFEQAAESVIHHLMNLLCEAELSASIEVAYLVRELVILQPHLRKEITPGLVDALAEISSPKVLRIVAWLVGEYTTDLDQRHRAMNVLYSALSPLPLPKPEADGSFIEKEVNTQTADISKLRVTVKTVVLPDGTYGTANVVEETTEKNVDEGHVKSTGLRIAVCSRLHTLLTSILGVAITKLALRHSPNTETKILAETQNKALYMVACLVNFSMIDDAPSAVHIRLKQCLCALTQAMEKKVSIKTPDSSGLKDMVYAERDTLHQEELNFKELDEGMSAAIEEDSIDGIVDMCGSGNSLFRSTPKFLNFQHSLKNAIQGCKNGEEDEGVIKALMKSSKAVALSGLSDPVYVEAVLTVHHLTLLIELLLINQTSTILEGITISLGTHGDMKMVERPTPLTLSPNESGTVCGVIRLSGTEAGVIFGYCGYQHERGAQRHYFALNELQIDLLDCMRRVWIGHISFRTLWAEFEWENKVAIQLPPCDPLAFLSTLLQQTKMTVVGIIFNQPKSSKHASLFQGVVADTEAAAAEKYTSLVREDPKMKEMANSRIFVVNLCSQSIFDEEALLNLSLERCDDKSLRGAVRIRSRTQGIALSLGDRISQTQRTFASQLKVD